MRKYSEKEMEQKMQEMIDFFEEFNKKLPRGVINEEELQRVELLKTYKERRENGHLTDEEKKQETITNEIFSYIRETFPNIENENAPFVCSSKFYGLIENLILIGRWFHTDKKLFQTALRDWKTSDDYVELFKKTIDFYRTEIYDKIPE